MIKNHSRYYEPVEEPMLTFFWESFFAPIVKVLDLPLTRTNASISALLQAIRKGEIQYERGVFRGTFNVHTSRELSEFATFNPQTHLWRGNPPTEIKAVAAIAKSKRDALMKRINDSIASLEHDVNDSINALHFGDDLPLFKMAEDVNKDIASVAVAPEITKHTERVLRKQYTENNRLDIKNWLPEQILRLREMIERLQTTTDNRSIQDAIQQEWNTSAAKARFLARQETGLFLDAFSRGQAESAGVRRYRWSTSHDERVRPTHKHLDGMIIDLDRPPIVDLRTGRRAHAGQDFNCRCGKIWVLE